MPFCLKPSLPMVAYTNEKPFYYKASVASTISCYRFEPFSSFSIFSSLIYEGWFLEKLILKALKLVISQQLNNIELSFFLQVIRIDPVCRVIDILEYFEENNLYSQRDFSKKRISLPSYLRCSSFVSLCQSRFSIFLPSLIIR